MAEVRIKDIDEHEIDTILAEDIDFEGHLTFKKPLMIKGKFKGEIKSTSSLYIGEKAYVEATTEAGIVSSKGRHKGDIVGHSRVELFSTAQVDGDITTPDFVVESGCKFNGVLQHGRGSCRKEAASGQGPAAAGAGAAPGAAPAGAVPSGGSGAAPGGQPAQQHGQQQHGPQPNAPQQRGPQQHGQQPNAPQTKLPFQQGGAGDPSRGSGEPPKPGSAEPPRGGRSEMILRPAYAPRVAAAFLLAGLLLGAPAAFAQDKPDALELYRANRFADAIKVCQQELAVSPEQHRFARGDGLELPSAAADTRMRWTSARRRSRSTPTIRGSSDRRERRTCSWARSTMP